MVAQDGGSNRHRQGQESRQGTLANAIAEALRYRTIGIEADDRPQRAEHELQVLRPRFVPSSPPFRERGDAGGDVSGGALRVGFVRGVGVGLDVVEDALQRRLLVEEHAGELGERACGRDQHLLGAIEGREPVLLQHPGDPGTLPILVGVQPAGAPMDPIEQVGRRDGQRGHHSAGPVLRGRGFVRAIAHDKEAGVQRSGQDDQALACQPIVGDKELDNGTSKGGERVEPFAREPRRVHPGEQTLVQEALQAVGGTEPMRFALSEPLVNDSEALDHVVLVDVGRLLLDGAEQDEAAQVRGVHVEARPSVLQGGDVRRRIHR